MGSPVAGQEAAQNRSAHVKGSVTPNEQQEIVAAFDKNGLPNSSRAARAVLLSYARSAEVQDLVARFLRENMHILAA